MPAVNPADANVFYRPVLEPVGWALLGQLADGWVAVDGEAGRMDMVPDGSDSTAGGGRRYGRFSRLTVRALVRRGYICHAGAGGGKHYTLTEKGRRALTMRPKEQATK